MSEADKEEGKGTEQETRKSRGKSWKSGEKSEKSAESPKVSPTGDMLTAHLLAMLNGWSAYSIRFAAGTRSKPCVSISSFRPIFVLRVCFHNN